MINIKVFGISSTNTAYLLCSTQYSAGDIRVDKEETCEVKKPYYQLVLGMKVLYLNMKPNFSLVTKVALENNICSSLLLLVL